MTSCETLTFYAGVTLGSSWTHRARGERVEEVLEAVGLTHAAHTQVRTSTSIYAHTCYAEEPTTSTFGNFDASRSWSRMPICVSV